MQQELRSLEQRWGLALQSAQFGVWDLDVVQQRVHYSPQWKAMLGYDASDEPDTTATWRDRVHPDDLAGMLRTLTAYLSGHEASYELEFRMRAADGSYRWVLSRGRIVEHDAEGHATRAVGTLTDMTARHEADALRIERDRAEAANRAKSEFLARMSHELRTPLNAVLGFAQLLAQQIGEARPDIAGQRRHVQQIERAGWHLLTMIEDVLDLSRVETGEMKMALEPVAVEPLLNAVIESASARARARGLAIAVTGVPGQAHVRADAERLAQVMANLLGNAIKYNREGGGITIAVTPAEGEWRLAVIDTGHGISPLQMVHLFEPFNRLGRNGAGTDGVGIGLALARWLVDLMDGRMDVRSTPGEGSSFEVVLPAAEPRAG